MNAATGARIRALVVMHTFGNPAEMDRLTALCRDRGIALVEDAAEALGSSYRGRHVGGDGLVSALSFNGNKIVTTGGGGAILTNDPALAARAKHLTTTARVAAGWNFLHDEIGYNFRMPNLNAALGCGQLDQLPGFLERKRSLAERYRRALSDIRGLRLFEAPPHVSPNHWLNALVLDEAESGARDEILRLLNDGGVQARPVWTLMHRLPMYAACPRMPLDVAESLERRIVNLPSSAALA